jgi:hypothetical protein
LERLRIMLGGSQSCKAVEGVHDWDVHVCDDERLAWISELLRSGSRDVSLDVRAIHVHTISALRGSVGCNGKLRFERVYMTWPQLWYVRCTCCKFVVEKRLMPLFYINEGLQAFSCIPGIKGKDPAQVKYPISVGQNGPILFQHLYRKATTEVLSCGQ